MGDKSEYKRLAKLDPVNTALDYDEIDIVMTNVVNKYFPEIKKIETLNSGSLKGMITIQNQSNNPVSGNMSSMGIAKGIGLNMAGAL